MMYVPVKYMLISMHMYTLYIYMACSHTGLKRRDGTQAQQRLPSMPSHDVTSLIMYKCAVPLSPDQSVCSVSACVTVGLLGCGSLLKPPDPQLQWRLPIEEIALAVTYTI